MNDPNIPNRHEAAQLLRDARDLIDQMGWSRTRYVERDEAGSPVAFDILGALQFATVRGNYRRPAYLLAKQHLEAACKPLTLRGFNRVAHTSRAILHRYEVALERLHRIEDRCTTAVVIPFPRARTRTEV